MASTQSDGRDDAPWTLERLARLTTNMRLAQRAYYRGRRKGDLAAMHGLLNAALEREAEVDAALRQIAEDAAAPLFPRGMPGD